MNRYLLYILTVVIILALAFYLTGFKEWVKSGLAKVYEILGQMLKKAASGLTEKIGKRIKQGVKEEKEEIQGSIKEKITNSFNNLVNKIKNIF